MSEPSSDARGSEGQSAYDHVDEAVRERIAASIYNTFTAIPGVTYGQLPALAEAADKASLNVRDIVNGYVADPIVALAPKSSRVVRGKVMRRGK